MSVLAASILSASLGSINRTVLPKNDLADLLLFDSWQTLHQTARLADSLPIRKPS